MTGYLPLIRKDSVTHMHGVTIYVKEGLVFSTGLVSRKFCGILLIFLLAFFRPGDLLQSQMALLRYLTFLLGSLIVTLTVLLFWIYLFLLTLVFVLQWLSLHWEILIMLSQFPLTSRQTQNGIRRFIV